MSDHTIAFEEGDQGSVPILSEEFNWSEIERELDGLPDDIKADARECLGRALFMLVCLLKQQRCPQLVLDLVLYNLGTTDDTLEAIGERYGVRKQAVHKENDKLVAFLFKGKARR